MIMVVSATEEHINRVKDAEMRVLLGALTEKQRAHAYAIEIDGVPLALGALNIVRPGIALAWLLHLEENRIPADKALRVVREIRKQLARIAKQEDVFRIQATNIMADARSGRFLEALGFQAEGILRSYGPNREDHVMWSIIYA